MKFIAKIFWNEDEHRIRALWRIVVQLILWIVITITLLLTVRVLIPSLKAATPEQTTMFEIAIEFLGTLLAVWLVGHGLDNRSFTHFGLRINKSWLIDFLFGLFLGGFLIILIFLIELIAGWITITKLFVSSNPANHFAITIFYSLATMIMAGTQEELIFRGYQLTNLAEGLNWKRIGPRWAILGATLLSAIIFAFFHLNNLHTSAASTLSVFMGGIILSLGFILTGELAISIGFHITWNFFQANVFGFTLSGGDYSWATFFITKQTGPSLWVGDAFGPESGLLAIGAVFLGCLLILLWVRWRYGKVGLHIAIVQPPKSPE